MIDAVFDRIQSKKPASRYIALELLNYFVTNAPTEFHSAFIAKSSELTTIVYNSKFVEAKLHIAGFVQQWAALQADGPFGDGYKTLYQSFVDSKIIIERQPETQSTEQPSNLIQTQPKVFLVNQEQVFESLSKHAEVVQSSCDLFLEALNFNTGYIGDNQLARELHSKLTQLKYANDKWIERLNELEESAVALLLNCSDSLAKAFNTFADMVANIDQSNVPQTSETPAPQAAVEHQVTPRITNKDDEIVVVGTETVQQTDSNDPFSAFNKTEINHDEPSTSQTPV